jgi:hypothetical protein
MDCSAAAAGGDSLDPGHEDVSRELAGLLGITVIGVVIAARQHVVARTGVGPESAYLSGYRLGLVCAGVLVLVGGLVAFAALRRTGAPQCDGADAYVLVG